VSENATGGRSGPDPDPDDALRHYADALATAVDAAIPMWVERVVRQVLAAQGLAVEADTAARLDQAVAAARDAGAPQVRDLLAMDIDEQPTTPLTLLRSLVRYPTEVLRAAGARPVARDEVDQRMFPDDVYGLTPASFADLDPSLHEPGLAWGAAKAYVHLSRRRRPGG
jgi:hypothetical protein